MIASRTASTSARAAVRASSRSQLQAAPLRQTGRRFASTEVKKDAAAAGGASGLAAGLAGGAVVFALGYGYYHFSGAKAIVSSASATKAEFEKLSKGLKDTVSKNAPEPNEAIKWLRSTATSYAVFIPGGKANVDAAFKDLDTISQKHGGEVEKIGAQAYTELSELTKKGSLDVETAQKAWGIVEKYLNKIGELASDSASEVLNNHPELKEKFGGSVDQLKSLADSYGPEAKKELDKTYSQIKDLVAGGLTADTYTKVKKLVDEKTQALQKLGQQAWEKGLKEAKPLFDKNPKIKELVESNADALKKGNVGELFEKVKEASNGSSDALEKYVKDAAGKAKDSGLGKTLESYTKLVPGLSDILPKFEQLQEVAKKHGDEAEKILKDATSDIQNVLKKHTEEAQKLADKAAKDAKK